MALIVQKFGGTSVNGEVRIKACVALVKKELALGNKVVVVVSAMAGVTDSLLSQALSMGDPIKKELDVILSAGEQISSGMMAIALNNAGVPSRSWAGWQLPINTDDKFTDASVQKIETKELLANLEEGVTPVIAGFQGVHNSCITTLGRGGTDTTAAAISAALNADRCDIYTDVDGVYTADPHSVPKVKKLKVLSYQEMLELSTWGAKVVHSNSVDIVMRSNVPMQVLSSFKEIDGTLITSAPYKPFTGITTSLQPLSILHIKGKADLTPYKDLYLDYAPANDGINILCTATSQKEMSEILRANGLKHTVKENLRSVSVVGEKSTTYAKDLDWLRNCGIVIYMTICSELRATIVIEASKTTDCIVALHNELFFNNHMNEDEDNA